VQNSVNSVLKKKFSRAHNPVKHMAENTIVPFLVLDTSFTGFTRLRELMSEHARAVKECFFGISTSGGKRFPPLEARSAWSASSTPRKTGSSPAATPNQAVTSAGGGLFR